jgi:hypothetical protein
MMTKFFKPFALCLLMLSAAGALSAQTSPAVIRRISGTVEVKAPGAADWAAAVEGQALEQKTLISTGFKSTALIVMGETTLTLRPLTRLSLEELLDIQGNERADVYLRTGRVRANVIAPQAGKIDFTIRSPSVTASVRGTAFDFDTVNLRVDEGRVNFAGADRTAVYVGAGQSSYPDPETGRTLSPVETAGAALSPPVPAGVETAAALPAVPPAVPLVPPISPAVPLPVDVGIRWPE